MKVSSALFSGTSTRVHVEALDADFLLVPATSRLLAEHNKRSGLTPKGMEYTISGEPIRGQIEFDPVQVVDANIWLAGQLIKGWDGLVASDGIEIPFSEENLQMLASQTDLIDPVIKAASELASIRDEVAEKN